MKLAPLLLLAIFLLPGIAPATGAPTLEHERLRVRNAFRTPEEVIAYYCARDASGFVWSGLLDSERRAFTLWEHAPEADTFLIARDYRIGAAKQTQDQATVEVRYELLAMGDAHGTTQPVRPERRLINFRLKRVGGAWKIAEPSAEQISPIVLQAKFPVPNLTAL